MPRSESASRGTLSRRSMLKLGATLVAWPLCDIPLLNAAGRAIRLKEYPFQLGVASGDPSPTGVVLWTRLAPDPLNGGGMPPEDVKVKWQVAHDEQFTRIVREGEAVAQPDWAHSVHVEVEGLEPDRWYFYRFQTGMEVSPTGRTRTTPRLQSTPNALRFAFASCQHYETGLYTAYEHMAREDLDLVVHLGDYIYDGASRDNQVRKHVGPDLVTLEDYRNRHAQYKTDAFLQATHLAFPWVVTWDDHEFDNNCAGAICERLDVSPEEFLKQRANAYKAYYEHMPLRRTAVPRGPDMLLYRRIPYGQLVEFAVLDTRQYRSDQPCGDRNKPLCPEALDPRQSMLGAEQEAWLLDGLKKSSARWNVLAQQVMMARVDRMPGEEATYSMDQWCGYDVNRTRILQFMADHNIANPVVLTGDIHTNWVNDLKINFDVPESPTVATEFVGTSISSSGDGSQTRKDTPGVLAENPFVRFYNAERGYVRCEVTPKEWRSDYQVVEYISRPGAPRITRASFVVENGRPGAQLDTANS